VDTLRTFLSVPDPNPSLLSTDAPSIHSDFLEWTEFWFSKYGQKMKGLSIKEFVEID
jgi:hypothetical protein